MTIAGMTARDSISLELDRKRTGGDTQGMPTLPTRSPPLPMTWTAASPQDAVACIRYTYNERPVGLYTPLFIRDGVCYPFRRTGARRRDTRTCPGRAPAFRTPRTGPSSPPIQRTIRALRDQTLQRPRVRTSPPATRPDITTKDAGHATPDSATFFPVLIIAIVAAVKNTCKKQGEIRPSVSGSAGWSAWRTLAILLRV